MVPFTSVQDHNMATSKTLRTSVLEKARRGDVRRLRKALVQLGGNSRGTTRADVYRDYEELVLEAEEKWLRLGMTELRKLAKSLSAEVKNLDRMETIAELWKALNTQWVVFLEEMVKEQTKEELSRKKLREAMLKLEETDRVRQEAEDRLVDEFASKTVQNPSNEPSVPVKGEAGDKISSEALGDSKEPSPGPELVERATVGVRQSQKEIAQQCPIFWDSGREPNQKFETWVTQF